MGKVSLSSGVGLSVLMAACGSGQRPPPAQPGASRAAAASGHFPAGAEQRVRSRALDFPVELRLPNRASWQIADGPTWLVIRHPESSSELALRTWRAERLVRRGDCEAQARLARPSLPTVHDESVVERRSLAVPNNFDTELVVGVEPTTHGIAGYAMAIGASVGSCYVAVFTTLVTGAGAEQEVAARLGIVVDRILTGVRLRSVDERALRRRILLTPAAPAAATPATPE